MASTESLRQTLPPLHGLVQPKPHTWVQRATVHIRRQSRAGHGGVGLTELEGHVDKCRQQTSVSAILTTPGMAGIMRHSRWTCMRFVAKIVCVLAGSAQLTGVWASRPIHDVQTKTLGSEIICRNTSRPAAAIGAAAAAARTLPVPMPAPDSRATALWACGTRPTRRHVAIEPKIGRRHLR